MMAPTGGVISNWWTPTFSSPDVPSPTPANAGGAKQNQQNAQSHHTSHGKSCAILVCSS
jgi:hypothetical protein